MLRLHQEDDTRILEDIPNIGPSRMPSKSSLSLGFGVDSNSSILDKAKTPFAYQAAPFSKKELSLKLRTIAKRDSSIIVHLGPISMLNSGS